MPPKSSSPATKKIRKLYRRHTGYPGGLTETGARKMRETRPERMLELAVSGMLPKTKLGKQMYRKLKVYAGEIIPIRRKSQWLALSAKLATFRKKIKRGFSGSEVSSTFGNGPPQDRDGARFSAARQRPDHGQPPAL